MYLEEQIADMLGRVIEASKKNDIQRVGYRKTEAAKMIMPEYHSTYKYKVDLMNRIKIHSEICGFPSELFEKKSPNMTQEEYDYIKNNYKQTTLPVYLDLLSTINRIFHDSNWNIDYAKDESEESLQQYVENEIELYGSLEAFVKGVLPHIKLTDANGIIVIKPSYISTIDNEGEMVVDTSKKLEPMPFYISSDRIVSEGVNYVFVEMEEKSEVSYAGKKQMIGRVFEFYDDQNIWRIEQSGDFVDYNFTFNVFFKHDRGMLPYKKLMGVPQIMKGSIVYLSPFIYVTDILDLVAINSSTLDLATKKCAFPFLVMPGNICEFENVFPDGTRAVCGGGHVYYEGKEIDCKGCGGTGLRTKVNVLRTLLLSPETSTSKGDVSFSQNPMFYVAPDTQILEFLRKEIANGEQTARKILHLTTSNTQITSQNQDGSSTATGMMLDMKALYAFVKPISDQIFSLYEFMMDWIRYERYGEDYAAPTFSYPISFDFHTEQDYLNEISAGQTANLPPSVMDTIITKYLQSTFYNEKHSANVFNLIVDSDRLLSFSNEDILLKLARGVVEKWEVILHDSTLNFISELTENEEDFFGLEFKEQKENLIALAKQKATDMQGTPVAGKGNMVQSILSGNTEGGQAGSDIGKLPLGVQQLALAKMRAEQSGDKKLASEITVKMKELLSAI